MVHVKLSNMEKKVYYAHFMGIYNTPQELRDIHTLQQLGLYVVNPNSKETSSKFMNTLDEKKQLAFEDYYEAAFDEVFGNMVRECDVFAFKALPDGRIPGGVWMELEVAKAEGKTIIELPSGIHARKMGRDDTREYLCDIGQR